MVIHNKLGEFYGLWMFMGESEVVQSRQWVDKPTYLIGGPFFAPWHTCFLGKRLRFNMIGKIWEHSYPQNDDDDDDDDPWWSMIGDDWWW
jgi:hypothetical protein